MAKKSSKSMGLGRKQAMSGWQLLTFALVVGAIGGVVSWAAFAAPLPAKSGPPHASGSSCTISPSQVALDQIWTVYATGLPTNSVNQILTFPDGAQSTGPITIASGGTYTTTGNSNMSATWGFIAPEQTGTYNYQYVGRIKWPAGTYTKVYATCSVVVQ